SWRALGTGPDPFLRHALIHAAHRIADPQTLQAALANPDPAVQAAALMLLDQPPRPRGLLGPDAVMTRIDARDPGLRSAALRVLMRHPDWSTGAHAHIRARLRAANPQDESALTDMILGCQDRADVQSLLAGVPADSAARASRRSWALETMSRSRLAPLPDCWLDALAGAIRDSEPAVRRAAVRAAAILQVPRLDKALLALADSANESPDLRLEALRATIARPSAPTAAAVDLLIRQPPRNHDPRSASA